MNINGSICDSANVCSQINLTFDAASFVGNSGDGYHMFAIAFSSVIGCFLLGLSVSTVIKIFR